MSPVRTICVTGQRGDVGSWLSRLYAAQGWEVIPLEEARAEQAAGGRWLHMAAKSPPADEAAIKASNQDYLASCLERAQELGLSEVIFFSAMSAHGRQDRENLDEDQPPLEPDAYGRSKLWGEEYLRGSPLKALCLRLPALLGLRNTTNFPSRCFETLVQGRELILSNQDRLFNNFLGVEDLFAFVEQVRLTRDWDVINLAVAKTVTLGQVVEIMAQELGSNSKILTTGRQGPFFNISTNRAQKDYGFVPPDPQASLKRWINQRQAWQEAGALP